MRVIHNHGVYGVKIKKERKNNMWEVWMKGKWIGIVETNYPWAVAYWTKRNAKLVQVIK